MSRHLRKILSLIIEKYVAWQTPLHREALKRALIKVLEEVR
jgi:hypothetical protein